MQYTFSLVLHSLLHYTLEHLVILTSLEYLSRESNKDAYSCTTFSNDSISEILDVSISPIVPLRSLMNFSSSLLFLMIVLHLFWINSSSIIILIVKGAWSERLWRRSGKMECLSIFRELAYKNMRSITELELLGLSVYQVGT